MLWLLLPDCNYMIYLHNTLCLIAAKMKKVKLLLLFAALFIAARVWAAPDIYDDIATAFQSGNPMSLAKLFDNRVDLSITGVAPEDFYVKAKAEQYLRDFFSKNALKSFTIIHKGSSKEGSKFGTGTLVTTNGNTYRVNFVVKASGTQNLIQELRIEKQ
jgi:hypothetical protein